MMKWISCDKLQFKKYPSLIFHLIHLCLKTFSRQCKQWPSLNFHKASLQMSAQFPVTEDHCLCMCCKLATYFSKAHKETDLDQPECAAACLFTSWQMMMESCAWGMWPILKRVGTRKKNRSSKAKGEKGFSQPLQYLCQGVLSSWQTLLWVSNIDHGAFSHTETAKMYK